MDTPTTPFVTIIGAGPTGLFLALQLKSKGVPFRIIDQKEGPSQHSKALGYWPRTFEMFRTLGLDQKVINVGNRFDHLGYFKKGKPLATIDLSHIHSLYKFAVILPQSGLERILIEALGPKVEWNTKLTDIQENACIVEHQNGDKEVIHTSYIVGCDGAKSTLRELINFPFEKKPYPEHFVLADATFEWPVPANILQLHLSPYGPCVFFPFGKKKWRAVYIRNKGEDQFSHPTKDQVEKHISDRCGKEVHLQKVDWISPFGIQHALVKNYRKGNCFLAGDAAHVHSPAGGQGANTGMQDAYNLAWRLSHVYYGCDPTLLNDYEKERKQVAKSVVEISDRMTKGIELYTKFPWIPTWLIRGLLKSVFSSKKLQETFTNRLGEISINYRNSHKNCEYVDTTKASLTDQVMPGDLAPNVSTAKGELMDAFNPNEFTLLCIGPEDPFLGKYTNKIVTQDPKIKAAYGVKDRALFVIRPDRYVEFRSNCYELKGYTIPTLDKAAKITHQEPVGVPN